MFRSAIALLVFVTALTQYAPDLQYQKRGDRFEGVRAGGVSGYDVELLSARVESSALPATWPDTAAVSFFLPESTPVHLVVRQLRPPPPSIGWIASRSAIG